MQRPGDELFAGAGLAADQRRPDVRRQPADHVEELLHRGAAPDHPAEFETLGDVPFDGEQAAPAIDFLADAGQ